MRVLPLLLISFMLTACGQKAFIQPDETSINHVVMIWLKESGNQTHREQVLAASHSLSTIPGVLKIRVGEVILSQRSIVDDSFDVGLHMLFADKDAMQKYVTHPQHIDTVKKQIAPLVKKITVYDF
jgi:hypothetical protein